MEALDSTSSEAFRIAGYEQLLAHIRKLIQISRRTCEKGLQAQQASQTLWLVITYFVGNHTACRILHQPSSSTQLNIKTELPFVIVNPQRISLWLETPFFRAIELGCTVFMVDEDAVHGFLDDYIPTHDEAMFRIPNKFVIVAMQSTGKKVVMLIEEILAHRAVQEMANLLLIVPNNNSFELITHRYVGNLPEMLDLIHLDTYNVENGTFLNGNILFPSKLNNLMGKTLKLASFYLLPWIMTRQADDGIVRYLNQSYTIDGLDGYLLIEFGRRFNCNWDLSIEQIYQYGQVFENHTGNGMIGALAERKVDFALAAVGGWHQLFKYFSFSIPIQWIGITGLAPRPKLIQSWRIIFLMFSKSVWAMVLITFILCSLLECVLPTWNDASPKARKSISWSFVNVLGVFLMQPAILKRSRASEVFISVALLIFTFIIGYVYMGKTSSIRTFPLFLPPIDTIYDLAVSDIAWNAPHEIWKYAIIGTQNPYVLKLLDTFHVAPIPMLRTIADAGEETIVMAALHFGHFMVGTWFTAENIENFRPMSEWIFFEYDTGYATKTWPLLDNFDYLSMWFRDACLSQYVELVEVFNYMDYGVETSIKHSKDRQRSTLKPLCVGDIEGGLIILGCGYLAALAALVFERAAKALEVKRTAMRLAAKWKHRVFLRKLIAARANAETISGWTSDPM